MKFFETPAQTLTTVGIVGTAIFGLQSAGDYQDEAYARGQAAVYEEYKSTERANDALRAAEEQNGQLDDHLGLMLGSAVVALGGAAWQMGRKKT